FTQSAEEPLFICQIHRGASPERNITIKVETRGTDIIFTYKDSGPGLSKDIKNPDSIFEPFETTKRDPHSGEEIGTGLGMWLVKLLVVENNGTIQILKNCSGFGVSIEFFNKLR
ncbi:MAG: ATP-binding protein, partial [Anaerolineae bacterium]|nr:ATP-binding protein [Anaerolineae bacterium]